MNLNLTRAQFEFYNDNHRFCLLRGGIGSGKTYIGAHKTIKKIYDNHEALGLVAANTYRQLHNVTLKTLFIQLEMYGLSFSYNQNKGLLSIEGSQLICASLDNYDVLRGLEIGYFWIDEARDCRKEAFEVLMGRLRDKKASKHQGWLTTSPKGWDWTYDYFEGENKTKDFHLVETKTTDNIYLPGGYAESLKEVFSEKLYEQEVLGRVVNITSGNVYYSYERSRNVSDCNREPNHSILVGLDFNVNPMCGVIAHYINNTLYVFDDIYVESSNTHEVADYIKRKYGTGHTIIPDATGKALKTSSAGLSDHQILEQAGFRIPKVRNPFRADRYNCVNLMLEKGNIVIDNKCKKLIRDIEQLTYKEGTDIPDTTRDKTLSHISDALGYLAWHVNPLINKKVKVAQYA